MGSEHAPLILIELVLVFGSVLAFAWWQLRSLERDRKETLRQRELQSEQDREQEVSEHQRALTGADHNATVSAACTPQAPQAPQPSQVPQVPQTPQAAQTAATDRGGER